MEATVTLGGEKPLRGEDESPVGLPREPAVRCAIYTRRSPGRRPTEQSNSVEVQREAAEAFVASRRSDGWVALPARYDDDGVSGADASRPALQRLLADVQGGEVDCVVVYKVDRLARSLLGAARLMEFLHEWDVTLESVTQPLDAHTSAGRLTRSALFSFAELERDLFRQRLRDTIGAARRAGQWFAGPPMHGYRLEPGTRRLIVVEQEAAVVREIFELYLEHRSLTGVARELARRGRRTREQITKAGQRVGGVPFCPRLVGSILDNVTCTGRVRWDGETYTGEHEAIIPDAVFDAAARIRARTRRPSTRRRRVKPLLGDKLYCRACDAPMKRARRGADGDRFWYYVCTRAQKQGWDSCPTRGMSAPAADRTVLDALRALAADPERQRAVVSAQVPAARQAVMLRMLRCAISPLAESWTVLKPPERNRAVRALLQRVDYDGREARFHIRIHPRNVVSPPTDADRGGDQDKPSASGGRSQEVHFEVQADATVMAGNCPPDRWVRRRGRLSLAERLAAAHELEQLLRDGRATDYTEVSRRIGLAYPQVCELVSLLFLAPAIQEDILWGDVNPAEPVTVPKLRRIAAELDWRRQVEMWRALQHADSSSSACPAWNHRICQEVERLKDMTASQLRSAYQQLFGIPSRSPRRAFMTRRIAWRIQASAYGGLSEAAHQRVRERGSETVERLLRRAPPNESPGAGHSPGKEDSPP